MIDGPMAILDDLYGGADDFKAFHAALESGDVERAASHHSYSEDEIQSRLRLLWWEANAVAGGVVVGIVLLAALIFRTVWRWWVA